MRTRWILSLAVIFSTGSFSSAEVKPYMNQMFQEIFTLKPYIVSEEAFKDPKNSEKIDISLKKMVEISKDINHEMKIQRSGFQISGKVLTQQLKETELVFRTGSKNYALWMLRSTLNVCMNCHIQLPGASTHFHFLNQKNVLTNPFEEAEFLYTVRNFDEAMKLYGQSFAGYPKNAVSVDSIEKALYRQLSYYVRVHRDMDGLTKALDEDLKNKQLPKKLIKKIQGFKKAAIKMKEEPYPSFTKLQEDEVRKYAEGVLKDELAGKFSFEKPEKELAYLKVSGVLYEYLEQNPGTRLKPDILYWLSFCETRYGRQLSFSIPELYLKQCVLEFPKNPVAKRCLEEYQSLVTFAYSGSSGTHVPADVEKEIKTMQELVKQVP